MSRYISRYLTITSFALFLNVISLSQVVAQPDGGAIFKANCTSCHVVGDNKVVGPGLKNVHQRHSEEWLLKWIKNSSALIKSGDAEAVKVYEEYNKTAMPSFNLSVDEIKSVIAYIKTESEKAPAAAAQGTTDVNASSGEESQEDGSPIVLLLVVCGFIALYFILNSAKKGLERVVRQREGLPEPPIYKGKAWVREHKKLIAVIIIFLSVVGSVKGWYALKGIGVQEGYQPDQPIKFSHALHVGQNKIDCRYCHSGAEKSKNANIPSPMVCMNCHKYVQEGPKYGTEEIAKIYKAVGWDKNKQAYTGKTKAIQWVRIHNLPDLAYFNHAQHVKVGQVACQTCHGEVEKMEEMKQASPLTMGWCINCHRQTEVKMDGNGYYKDLHEKLKKQYGPDAKLTVDKIGGLECARCHY